MNWKNNKEETISAFQMVKGNRVREELGGGRSLKRKGRAHIFSGGLRANEIRRSSRSVPEMP